MIWVHFNFVNNSCLYVFLRNETNIFFHIKHYFHSLFLLLRSQSVFHWGNWMSTVHSILLLLFLKFVIVLELFLPHKINILSILFRNLVYYSWICSFVDMILPLFVLQNSHIFPLFKYLFFSFNYTVLPHFIVTNWVVLILSEMTVV